MAKYLWNAHCIYINPTNSYWNTLDIVNHNIHRRHIHTCLGKLKLGKLTEKSVWYVAIYICKDNHLSNCSIIFIIIAQYTQMYLKDRTAWAEDSKSLNVVLKRNSELGTLRVRVTLQLTVSQSEEHSAECIFLYPWVGPTEDMSLLVLLMVLPSNGCLHSRC
jgi:hypothetical protein